jgi:hypothetical protein
MAKPVCHVSLKRLLVAGNPGVYCTIITRTLILPVAYLFERHIARLMLELHVLRL